MNAPATEKPTIAVYLRYYLSPSETFVYRQLQGVACTFEPIVFTSAVRNLHRFPWDELHVQGKNVLEKAYTRIWRMATGRFSLISSRQRSAWRRLLLEKDVRLIHAHFGHFALDVLPLARDLEIPMVVSMHGFDASVLLGNATYVSNLKDLASYARIVAVSNAMAQRLAGVGVDPSNVHVHYVGAPVDAFTMPERRSPSQRIAAGEPLRFLQVSNFVEVKGHVYTIDAFARYRREHDGATLTLAGDGPLRRDMEKLCEQLGLRDVVTFTGVVDKERVIELMHGHDVALLHSVTLSDGCMEGAPTVFLMEAMATGMTVVASRHSAIPELVEDGVTGFLVPERDVDRYADALEGLSLADPSIGARARARVEASFNLDTQTRGLIEIYRSAMR